MQAAMDKYQALGIEYGPRVRVKIVKAVIPSAERNPYCGNNFQIGTLRRDITIVKAPR